MRDIPPGRLLWPGTSDEEAWPAVSPRLRGQWALTID